MRNISPVSRQNLIRTPRCGYAFLIRRYKLRVKPRGILEHRLSGCAPLLNARHPDQKNIPRELILELGSSVVAVQSAESRLCHHTTITA